jgi:hypothetical protein
LGSFGLFGVLSGVLCGCASLPESYSPPPQRPFFEAPPEAARILSMADADAESHFVQDISLSLEANSWRWTGKRPTIRLHPDSNRRMMFSIDLAIAGTTLEHTGPVTLSLFVNNHLLDRAQYATPGRRQVERAVPAEWIDPHEDVVLAAEIDKLWSPAPDAKPLGFILHALGLEQK